MTGWWVIDVVVAFAILAGLLMLGCPYLWMRRMADPVRPPHCTEHRLVLHPVTQDRLSCMFCPYDAPLPSGAPRSPAERFKWAKRYGLLHGQDGCSVAFLEALERIG